MKDRIVAITSKFGLGPVGKLASIINSSGNLFEWYATGQEFDVQIFNKNIFKKVLWTEEEEKIKKFIIDNDIKYALVILKNKFARFLKSIGLKVIYVDSLPFMWTDEDADNGKVPYNVDVYCAQKSINLSKKSQQIFNKVKNLKWINHIIPDIKLKRTHKNNSIVVNVGGLHSPVGNGEEYVNVVIKPLIYCLKEMYRDKNIMITCGSKARENLVSQLKSFNIKVKTLCQSDFLKNVKESYLFFTSPGLTTILEVTNIDNKVIMLPPQNLSQFYNIEYGKKILHKYKTIEWNKEGLSLNDFANINMLESEIVLKIYEKISELQNYDDIEKQKNYILKILKEEKFIINPNYKRCEQNGAKEVVKYIKDVIGGRI